MSLASDFLMRCFCLNFWLSKKKNVVIVIKEDEPEMKVGVITGENYELSKVCILKSTEEERKKGGKRYRESLKKLFFLGRERNS